MNIICNNEKQNQENEKLLGLVLKAIYNTDKNIIYIQVWCQMLLTQFLL